MKVWIDLENTPHVPFFKPIVRELERRGHPTALTARDAFQVCELAERTGMACRRIGRHYGKNPFLKVWGLGWRSAQLFPFAFRHRPDLALSHGSRAQILLCNFLRIPTVMIMDYEHARTPPLVRPRWEIVPEVLLQGNLHCRARERIRAYRGIKEDVYAPELVPDPSLLRELGLHGEITVTVRPPATEAHYHNPESEVLFARLMERLCQTPLVKTVLLPRNKAQEAQLRAECPHWFATGKVIIPAGVVDGLNLLWHCDLVVSGGGTMNREAAALGVPVYSIFRGKLGLVDRQLQRENRLILIERPEEIDEKIRLAPREKKHLSLASPSQALVEIIDHIEAIGRIECPHRAGPARASGRIPGHHPKREAANAPHL